MKFCEPILAAEPGDLCWAYCVGAILGLIWRIVRNYYNF